MTEFTCPLKIHSFKSRYRLFIDRKEKVGIEKIENPKTLIDYSQKIDDVYGNLESYNPKKKRKVLIVIEDLIADM